MTVVRSRPFAFARWHRLSINSTDPRAWTPVRTDGDGGGVVAFQRNMWVYAFLSYADRTPVWQGEYRLTVPSSGGRPIADTRIAVTDMQQARTQERDVRVAPVGSLALHPGLEHTYGYPDQPVEGVWRFYGSEFRLHLASIRWLEENCARVLPPVHLGQDRSFTTLDGVTCVPYVDPLTIALSQGVDFESARDALRRYTTGDGGGQASARLLEKGIAESLVHLVGGDADLRDEFDGHDSLVSLDEARRADYTRLNIMPHAEGGRIPRGERAMRDFLVDFDERTTALARATDHAAWSATTFLGSDLWRFVERAARVEEASDIEPLLDSYVSAVRRLGTSPAGRSYLEAELARSESLARTYGMPSSDPSSTVSDVLSRSNESLHKAIELWETLATHRIGTSTATSAVAREVSEGLNHLIGGEPAVRVESTTVAGRTEYGGAVTTVEVFNLDAMREVPEIGLTQFIDVINLALTARQLCSSFSITSATAWLNLMSLSLSLAQNAGKLIFNMTERMADKLAVVTAVVDAVIFGVAAYDAATIDDYNAAAGDAIASLGCVCIAVGGTITLSGVGAPIGGALVFVGTVLTVGGAMLAFFGADTPIETFVGHSSWGRNRGSGGEVDWAWAPGEAPRELSRWWRRSATGSSYFEGAQRQYNSLMQLVSGFRVVCGLFFQLFLRTGMVQPSSWFRLRVVYTFDDDTTDTGELNVLMGSQSYELRRGAAAHVRAFRFSPALEGGRYVVGVTYLPDRALRDRDSVSRVAISVRFHMSGDEDLTVPSRWDLEFDHDYPGGKSSFEQGPP